MYQAPHVAPMPVKISGPLCVSPAVQVEPFEEFEVPIN